MRQFFVSRSATNAGAAGVSVRASVACAHAIFTSRCICLIILVGSVGACSSARDANTSNFEETLRSWYASQNTQQCVVGGPATLSVAMNMNGPGEEFKIPTYELSNSQEIAKEEALVAAGLLSRSVSKEVTPATDTWPPALDAPAYTTTYNTYKLTAEGSKYSSQAGGAAQFCYAGVTVDKVTNFTLPVNSGYSRVTHTYALTNVADWARSPAIQSAFPEVASNFSQEKTEAITANLTLTNNGWEVSQ